MADQEGGGDEVALSFMDKVRFMMYGEQEKEAFLIEKKEKEEKKKGVGRRRTLCDHSFNLSRAGSRGVQPARAPIPNHKFENSRALYCCRLEHNRKERKSLVYSKSFTIIKSFTTVKS
ncbi:hypothetical protein AVEN_95163-1 [Araneus ventricosus]|uniref:Uncharacterized protein n=1 Tax=Araneus ventricosus TaxID=182803 RepID=A0A4Y2KHM4_ARAVE|nr:hypothetical protein AVEN_95163-1 [Araneus ventricosus]